MKSKKGQKTSLTELGAGAGGADSSARILGTADENGIIVLGENALSTEQSDSSLFPRRQSQPESTGKQGKATSSSLSDEEDDLGITKNPSVDGVSTALQPSKGIPDCQPNSGTGDRDPGNKSPALSPCTKTKGPICHKIYIIVMQSFPSFRLRNEKATPCRGSQTQEEGPTPGRRRHPPSSNSLAVPPAKRK